MQDFAVPLAEPLENGPEDDRDSGAKIPRNGERTRMYAFKTLHAYRRNASISATLEARLGRRHRLACQ